MPNRQASIALIRHHDEPEQHWLAFWNVSEKQFSFVVAERLENESWRECLDRDLAWELDLRRGKDYLISSMARLHYEEAVVEPGCDEPSKLEIEFYVVDPYGQTGREAFRELPDSRWLSNEELRSGSCKSGEAIDPWLVDLLRKADLFAKG